MVKSWKKFINKSPIKNELNKIINDISSNNLEWYYIRKLEWYNNLYRIRKWKIRIIFEKWEGDNYIVAVDTRWQVYRWLKTY